MRMFGNSHTKPLVVVSDPDRGYQALMVALLRPYFEVWTAGSLRETWDITWQALGQVYRRGHWPLLLILELRQPDGDGLKFVEYLHQDATLRSILIACVSEQRELRWKLAAVRAGADDFVVKCSTSWRQPGLPQTFAGMMLLLQQQGTVSRMIASTLYGSPEPRAMDLN